MECSGKGLGEMEGLKSGNYSSVADMSSKALLVGGVCGVFIFLSVLVAQKYEI